MRPQKWQNAQVFTEGQGPADVEDCGEVHSHPQCLPAERYRTLPAWEKPDPVPSSLEQIFPTQAAADGEDSASISGLCRECAKDSLQWLLSAEGCSFSEQLQLSKKHGRKEMWSISFSHKASVPSFVDSNFKPPLPSFPSVNPSGALSPHLISSEDQWFLF